MHRKSAPIAALACLLTMATVQVGNAQDSPPESPTAKPAATSDSTRPMRFAKYRKYPWNGVNVWAGNAYETRSASHNRHIAGELQIVGVQISRDIWRGTHSKLAYVGEVLPFMHARSGPPANRAQDSLNYVNQTDLERLRYREANGVGLAPFGLELSRQLMPRVNALVNTTAGALIFNKIVPYGAATKANFTVSPGAALEVGPFARTSLAVGYTFHHLSNASFGASNPGMNSQLLYLRISRLRGAAAERK